MELFWIKNVPIVLLIVGLPFRVIFWAGSLVRAARSGEVVAFAHAKLAAIQMAPRFWRKRRDVMKLRRIGSVQLLGMLESQWLRRGWRRLAERARDHR